MSADSITRKAIKEGGGPTALGRKLGISQQAVQQWRRVPAVHCLAVESITGISRYDLRPDIYGRNEGNGHRAA